MEPKNVRPFYPGNSSSSKKQRVVERVTKRQPSPKKKSLGENLKELFFALDFKEAVKSVLFEVLLPDTKGTLSEMLKGTVDMLFYGDRRGGRTRGGKAPNYNYTNYSQYSNEKQNLQQKQELRPHSKAIVEDLVFETREDAEEVLAGLNELLYEYGTVSISSFYGLAGVTALGDYTKDNYGWMNLDSATIIRTRDGWLLDLPRPKVIV